MEDLIEQPRVLFFDVENSHSIVATYEMWDTNIPHTCVLQEWFMFCVSWRWFDKKKVESVSLLDNKKRFKVDYTDDYHVIAEFHKVLSQADAIVGHNLNKFDIKKFNARAIYHGLPPVKPLIQIDTLQMARSLFKFNYNKLDYLAEYLGVGKKLKTGIELWLSCLDGDVPSLKKMVKYNKHDIFLLIEVYKILAPYCPNKLNRNLWSIENCCALCGSENIQKRGFYTTNVKRWGRVRCNDCGKWGRYPINKSGKGGLIR